MNFLSATVYSKALAIFLAASLFLLGAVIALTQMVIFREFNLTEQREMKAMLQRFSVVMAREARPLAVSVGEWAHSGSIKDFSPGRKRDLGRITPKVLHELGIDFVALYDARGKMRELVSASPAMEKILRERDRINQVLKPLTENSATENRSGYMVIGEQLYSVVVCPIELKEPGVDGTLVGGKLIGRDSWGFLEGLFAATIKFQVFKPSKANEVVSRDIVDLLNSQEVVIQAENSTQIMGYRLISGLNGNPLGYVSISQPRPLRQQGLRAIQIFLTGICLAGGALVLVVWFLLDRTILARIKDLTRKLDAEKRSGRLPVQLDFKGEDELGILAQSIENLAGLLQNTQSRYQAVVEDQTEMICRFDADEKLTFANRVFTRTFHLEKRSLEEHTLKDVLPDKAHKDFQVRFGKLSPEKSLTTYTHEMNLPEGEAHWFRSTLRKNFSPEGACLEGQWVSADVTGQIEAQRQTLESEGRFRKLSANLLRLQDEERRRIARELHDSTAQNLSALEMNMSLLAPLLSKANSRAAQLVEETRQIAGECSRELRNISYLLHPPLIDEVGLAFAVKWFADGFSERTGITSTVEIGDDFPRLDPDIEMPLFRVVQEAMTNVYRHSGADHAWVTLRGEDRLVSLEIRDNGHGFEGENLADDEGPSIIQGVRPGVGLAGMRERLANLGGELDIENSPLGVTINVRLTLSETRNFETSRFPQ